MLHTFFFANPWCDYKKVLILPKMLCKINYE